ncbi:hypothetical protein EMGBD4_06040 [Verrucomicrobiota bacterium]|nr:hypothetical protein EMGBD4_06040 [Verrucomicrobiota bacterium]
MPEGLLQALSPEQQKDLLKYLMATDRCLWGGNGRKTRNLLTVKYH